MAMAIRYGFHIFLLLDRLSYIDCLGSGNSPNPIIFILLKKGSSLGSRSRIIKVFWFFEKTPLKGFTQVLISFTYYQRKGSIQPLPEGQRYNLPLDPIAIKSNHDDMVIIKMKRD